MADADDPRLAGQTLASELSRVSLLEEKSEVQGQPPLTDGGRETLPGGR